MAQSSIVRGVATSVTTDDGVTSIQYHSTIVVQFNKTHIRLESGGWRTATTKLRMNQASNQFDLGYRVFQRDHEWFVDYQGLTIKYIDNMILKR